MRVELEPGVAVFVDRREDHVALELDEAGLHQEVVRMTAERAYTVAMAILKYRRAILADRKVLQPHS